MENGLQYMYQMNILDRIFKKTPKQRTREPRAYHPHYWDGLQFNRERNSIPYFLKSARANHTWHRKTMASMSRYLYDNDGLVRGAINDLARYSFPLSPQAITDDPYWNLEAESLFEEWSQNADIGNRYGFGEIQRLCSIAIDRDGDAGIMFARRNGLKLQLIEGHRVGDFIEKDSNYVDGVKTDKYGIPISYLVADDSIYGEFHPKSTKAKEVPANSMCWLVDPDRAEQYRGMPAIKHAINHVRDIKEILEFEKNGVKNLSTIAAVLESETGEADPDAWNLKDIESDSTRLTISDVQSGSIPVLKKGEKLTPFTHDKPSPTFQGFLEFLIREFSVGIGLPYEFIWHPSGITGPAQRFIMGKAQRRFHERQRLFYIMVRKVWATVISDFISQGKLKPVDKWYKCRVQTPADITIDAGREMSQEREDVKAGLMTLREHYGKRGLDWQSECMQKAKEIEYTIEKCKTIAESCDMDANAVLSIFMQGEPPQIIQENERTSEDQESSDE